MTSAGAARWRSTRDDQHVTADGHALLDAGAGRRLERFGDRVVDRPAPGATDPRRQPDTWPAADLRFDRHTGWSGADLSPWGVALEGLRLEARPTEAGQVGIFPEHTASWPWLADRLRDHPGADVLHLFAYTGATTLALARCGARTTHVDASRPAVAWARRNAELSDLAHAPVRWIVDDARTFAAREARRGRRYAGILLDPPAWGHGAGRAWRLEDDLAGLLAACAGLLDAGGWLLLTAHSTGWDEGRLRDELASAFDGARRIHAGALALRAESGAALTLGAYASVIIPR